MMCWAPSAVQPATAETQDIADQVRSQLEEKENKKFPVFKAVSFKSQVVAGTNCFSSRCTLATRTSGATRQTPVVPATREAEAGEWRKPRRRSLQ
uniref:Cystatin-B n=1 Tax=Piliocolobus tephrosceles TaxID=591936 RepID=A0A8C9LHD1_9PRIM